MNNQKSKPFLLGQILLEQGLIDEKQLKIALGEQKTTKKVLGEILLSHGFISEKDLFSALAAKFKLPFMNISSYLIPSEVIDLLPKDFAREYKVLPISKQEDELTVAMIDPLNIFLVDELKRRTSCKIKPVIVTQTEIEQSIEQYYGFSGSIEELVKSVDKEKLMTSAETSGMESSIIKLVNLFILQAVRDRASDIHIEPEENFVRLRYRVDGILTNIFSLPKDLQMPIISRIKIMANINIAEKRLPQDGRIEMKVENRALDIRVSTQPTLFGENVVMRLLEKRQIFLNLEQLGFHPQTLKKYREVLLKPHGIILATGPTGSGKSTTLYVCLQKLNTEDKNIMTVEDPIEYQLLGVRQSQVNPKAGFNFASGLRAILRQDPDIIMVGEIRDLETAEIAIRAALTGHLVLSTLHTNDAPSAFTRLIDMGIEPFLIASSVIGVLAQRLVRVICPKCKESYEPSEEIRNKLNLTRRREETKILFYRGKGCPYCRNTGYYGRIGIFEFLPTTPELQELILRRHSTEVIRSLSNKQGMKTLFEDGLDKVLRGITTVEEVLHVATS